MRASLVGGDVGGFDIGSSSDLAWNLAVLGFHDVGKSGRILAGYRMLDVDRDKGGSTGVEMAFASPIVGYELRM